MKHENGAFICESNEEIIEQLANVANLIAKREGTLFQLRTSEKLFFVLTVGEPRRVLCYENKDLVFTSEERAEAFLDSFMDEEEKKHVNIMSCEDYGEIFEMLCKGILADGLVIKRFEFLNPETDGWVAEDLLYDPLNGMNKKFEPFTTDFISKILSAILQDINSTDIVEEDDIEEGEDDWDE